MKKWRRRLCRGLVDRLCLGSAFRNPPADRHASPLRAEVARQRIDIVTPRPNSNVLITSVTTSPQANLDLSDEFVIAQFNPRAEDPPASPLRASPPVSFDRAELAYSRRFSPESANVIPRSPRRRPLNRLSPREIVDDEFEIRATPRLTAIDDIPDDLFSSEGYIPSARSLSASAARRSGSAKVGDPDDLSDTVELQRAPATRGNEEEEAEEDWLSDRGRQSDSSAVIALVFNEDWDGLDF
jgi:hypothetical protein